MRLDHRLHAAIPPGCRSFVSVFSQQNDARQIPDQSIISPEWMKDDSRWSEPSVRSTKQDHVSIKITLRSQTLDGLMAGLRGNGIRVAQGLLMRSGNRA
jgi:hypothetical protein